MNKTILIVDENRETLELANQVLTGQGYSVRVARDAAEALGSIQTFKPRVILIDMLLPGEIDGLELARRLRANPATRNAAIVIATSKQSNDIRAKVIASGCNEFISGPITIDALCDLATAMMKKSAVGDPTSWMARYFEPPRCRFREQPTPTYKALTQPSAGLRVSSEVFASQRQRPIPAGIPATYKALTERPAGFTPWQARRPVVTAGVPTYKALTIDPERLHEMRLAG